MLDFVKDVLENRPEEWLKLTTHRLDVYNENLAKAEFLGNFEKLFHQKDSSFSSLSQLPTAYDYIRLGHPLSCLLEWVLAQQNDISAKNVISFASQTMPILAVLRQNLIDGKKTHIFYNNDLPSCLDLNKLKSIYGYDFEVSKVNSSQDIDDWIGSTIFISSLKNNFSVNLNPNIDFYIDLFVNWGSVVYINEPKNDSYISTIQHVRRRETTAMTPHSCESFLKEIINGVSNNSYNQGDENKDAVIYRLKEITNSQVPALLGSCGLSVQYAIMMGLIDHSKTYDAKKPIKIIVPPNCYGGTNDQARRVAASIENVEILDLHVDGDNDMVSSLDAVLETSAFEDAVSFIIAEIPTNPRVEVPNLKQLKDVLIKKRTTKNGQKAKDPIFILDQTFCPNVHFLGENDILSPIQTIAYVSGSKFPSGGLCTAGYCVGNQKSESLLGAIETHLQICDNQASDFQIKILAQQLPSMNQRISQAYKNARDFVNFIHQTLPEAKINFVSEDLAHQGFTPSVFSLDLPSVGNGRQEQEKYKRALNHKLIKMMIDKIPTESKHCVSYGQLQGCYWTIPATSTQGTTKENDKDYIVRVAVSPNMNVDLHKKVFAEFVEQAISL